MRNFATTLMAVLISALCAGTASAASFIYDDLDHYAETIDAIHNGETPEAAFARYLENATPGFQAYIGRYNVTAENMATAYERHTSYYEGFTDIEQSLRAIEAETEGYLNAMHAIAPQLRQNPVYYFIGPSVAGGANDRAGVLISVEVLGNRPTADISTYEEGYQPRNFSFIPRVVAHEMSHQMQAQLQGIDTYLQVYRDDSKGTLLNLSLREGTADFVSSLITNGSVNEPAYVWGRAHEAELWSRFQNEMTGLDTGEWMWVHPADGEQPMDMGYFLGHQIAQSYYENAADKDQALIDILSVVDFEGFLEASGYAERMVAAE